MLESWWCIWALPTVGSGTPPWPVCWRLRGLRRIGTLGFRLSTRRPNKYGYKPVEFQDRQASFTVHFYSVPERAGAAKANVPCSGAAVSDPAKTGNGIRDRILDFCKEPRSLEDSRILRMRLGWASTNDMWQVIPRLRCLLRAIMPTCLNHALPRSVRSIQSRARAGSC